MDIGLLWGATLAAFDFDVPAHRVRLSADIEEDGAITKHELVLDGVTDVRFRSSIEAPWNYAEMTEVRVTSGPGEATAVSILLWSEDAELTAVCERLTLDGQPVVASPS